MDSKWGEDQIWETMLKLYQMLKESKGEERSELARRYAVTITELEKVMGYYNLFVIQLGTE